ncbi:MAG TPA: hypothetical protein ENK35_04270, partial [Candidatus Tenderia sp.]|nr:hypothetical protein [Candidatus Tenderia sp.]
MSAEASTPTSSPSTARRTGRRPPRSSCRNRALIRLTTPPTALYLGIDFGTSGVRAIAIDSQEQIAAEARAPLPAPIRTGRGVEQAPAYWWQALSEVLDAVATQIDLQRISRLA